MKCHEQADVLRLVGAELHEHQSTVRGLLSSKRGLHILALKELMKNEPLEEGLAVPESL